MAEIVFVVLMLFWLFGGGFVSYADNRFNARNFGGYILIPWICVAILGYVVFTGYVVSVSHPVVSH